jgi:hypothetical protein
MNDKPGWLERMPQQSVAISAHDDPQPNLLHIPYHQVEQVIQAIWEGILEGDIYADGEVWADIDALHRWQAIA